MGCELPHKSPASLAPAFKRTAADKNLLLGHLGGERAHRIFLCAYIINNNNLSVLPLHAMHRACEKAYFDLKICFDLKIATLRFILSGKKNIKINMIPTRAFCELYSFARSSPGEAPSSISARRA